MFKNTVNKAFVFIKKYKVLSIFIAVFSVPIIIGQLIRIPTGNWTIGDENSWVGFFGSYIGAIIGGLVAYGIVRFQFDKQNNDEKQKLKETNRSYLLLTNFTSNFKLHNVVTSSESRIMLTEDYDSYMEAHKHQKDHLKTRNTSFYKLSHYGNPDMILNCKIEIYYKNKEGETNKLTIDVGFISKQEEIFIPLYSAEYKGSLYPTKVEISYTTVAQENMHYLYDLRYNQSIHYIEELVNGEIQKKEIMKFNLKNSTWIYPNKTAEDYINVKLSEEETH